MIGSKNYLLDVCKLLILIILMGGILISNSYGQSENYPYKIKSLTVDEGLSHTDANDIAQDQKGFLWIATYFGLDRFDGNSIKQFYNSNEPVKNAYKNRLTCIYPDYAGDIWLGTEGGLQRFDVRKERYIDYFCESHPLNNFYKIYKPDGNKIYALGGKRFMLFEIKGKNLIELKLPLDPGISVNDFIVVKDRMILATSAGLMLLDSRNHLTKFRISGLLDERLNFVNVGKGRELLIAAKEKFYVIAPSGSGEENFLNYKVTKWYSSPHFNEIKNVIHDSRDTYWVNEGGMLVHLDRDLLLKQVISSKNPQQTLSSSSLTKIFVDRSQCLWICMFGGGVNYFDLNEKPFYTLAHLKGDFNSLSGNFVRSVLADGNDLWIGVTDGGLNRYNRKTHEFVFYNTYNSSVRLKSDMITSLTLDQNENLWIGSYKGIEVLDRKRKKILFVRGAETFPKYAIEVLTTDYFGNIWFGNHTDQYGVIFKDNAGTYHTKYYGEGFFILADQREPNLMISSTHGLKRVRVDAAGNILEQKIYKATGKRNSLSSDYTYPIVKENDSLYWVGTIGGGLNKLLLKSEHDFIFEAFGNRYGIFNDVESLELDDNGNIWMGGNGLERFNPTDNRLIRYDKNDGLQGNSFKVGASYKGEDGCLYFGGINGLNYFYPDQITENMVMATPRITDISINNQVASFQPNKNAETYINQSVSYSENLKINYKQNNFVVFFSAMHFANPLKCKYRYKLVGFDKEWRSTDGRHPSAAYNNIDYADYVFQVQASNDDGVWSKETAVLKISVTPPWYKSWPAKIIYAALFMSVLIGFYLYQARWHTLKRDVEIAKVDERKREEIHAQREELHQQQLVFFTNISHEFRTPLTLIVGPLEYLMQENKDVHLDSSYQLIMRNARRLMNLIAELMNFKKVADSVIKLQVRQLNISQFCKGLFVDFENIALKKDVRYRFINNIGEDSSSLVGWFDVQLLEKILYNLLNNAFKYTENNGQVTLEIFFDLDEFKPSFANEYRLLNEYRADNYLYIRVADTGIGISSESIGNIFERYYRISSSHIGSGVGLALVKSLTQLHKGDIYVYSERMAGTEIIVGIPWGEINYDESEKVYFGGELENQLEIVDKFFHTGEEVTTNVPQSADASTKRRILIVEDNIELRRFLMQVLGQSYQLYEAEDGEAGLKLATEKIPDVIISDVMMPNMNGIEFCRAVKEKFETRHIPFIILSAKNAVDARIEGMELGADFYFAKPISIDLLLLTIRNVISQQEVAKERFLNNYLTNATELVQSEIDKDFFDKLILTITENIQDANMDVDFLCKHLYVSRTKLYQKIKSITGQSVGEFIRTIRLKRSIEIMTHENISMNEVAERIGMQSSSNFSRTFKKEYGLSPMQFIQSLKNDKKQYPIQ